MNNSANNDSQQRALFKGDFLDDWILILSFSIIGIGIFMSSKNFGHFGSFSSSDWITLAVDNGFTASINFLILAVIPASIRRYVRNKRSGDSSEFEPVQGLKLLGLFFVLLVASTSLGSASSNKDVERTSITSQERCDIKDDYELCIKATLLEENRAEVVSRWNYKTERYLSGSQVSAIEVKSIIDCDATIGTIEYLYAYGPDGQRVGLLKTDLETMVAGIQRDQVDQLVSNQCE